MDSRLDYPINSVQSRAESHDYVAAGFVLVLPKSFIFSQPWKSQQHCGQKWANFEDYVGKKTTYTLLWLLYALLGTALINQPSCSYFLKATSDSYLSDVTLIRSLLDDCCSSSFSRKYSSTHCSSNSCRHFSSSAFRTSSAITNTIAFCLYIVLHALQNSLIFSVRT